ncbi:MAG: hypothetical protein A2W31_07995 [Planctomycetes bacterium RBG_16_64_10]|nr:MAG: hypothetical protein A2W31_07995 [Planctomycetes bacterium RBG_16_64_10]
MKRLLDITVSLTALLLFLPLGLVIAAVLRLTGEGEVFYAQIRVGKDRRCFRLLKFATMLKDSPKMGTGTVTVRNDVRVLPVGRLLRKTKLNEVVQLINVLKGDMSLVGPRPLTRQTFRYYPKAVQRRIVQVKPGLTGIGSVVFRDEEDFVARSGMDALRCYREVVAPYKGALETWYLDHRSLWVDLKLVLLTAFAIVAPHSTLHSKLLKGLPQPPPSPCHDRQRPAGRASHAVTGNQPLGKQPKETV